MKEKSQRKMPVYLPMHPEPQKSIKACPSPGLVIISKYESLGKLFREAVESAGIPMTRKGSKRKARRPSPPRAVQ
ncbi:hypothetical protein [Bradyrhizobium sp. DASA03120]|uniref:hypothetical protein n=1 Tax=Bradyrhizobium sp. SMVTL-02 TaxID=3395917 RepID=UPI003F72B305